MADEYEGNLTQATTLGATDFFRIVKNLTGTPLSQVISRANVKAYFDGLYLALTGGTLTGKLTINATDGNVLRVTSSSGDNVNKIGRAVVQHYDIDEEDIYGFALASLNGSNLVVFGGAAGSNLNAATSIQFLTAATPTTLNGTLRMALDNLGNVIYGTGVGPTGGGIPAVVLSQASGNPTGIGSNTAGLIAKDNGGTCELYAWDEAGNVTLISPHAKDAPDWVYDDEPGIEEVHKSENVYLGRITWRNETRKNKLLQMQLDGEALPTDPLQRKFFVEENFAVYNERLNLHGAKALQVQDWEAGQQLQWERRQKQIERGEPVEPYVKKAKPSWLNR